MSETTTAATAATVTQPRPAAAPQTADSTMKATPRKGAPKAKKTAKGKAAKKTAAKPAAKKASKPDQIPVREGTPAPAAAKKAKPAGKRAAAKGESRPDSKKGQVREMLRKGTTLAAIIEATGWQPHTTRGFISILAKKEGLTIESLRTPDGGRSYKIAS